MRALAERSLRTVAAVGAVLASVGCAKPPPPAGLAHVPHLQVSFYDVDGGTEQELRSELNRLRATDFVGTKADSATEWFIHWRWPGYGSSQCDLESADVTYEIKVILPRWSPPAGTPAALGLKWRKYLDALIAHERGHIDHVVANYTVVTAAIRHATCETADDAATAALAQLRKFDVDYDAATNHGINDGARFP